jgi:hypothetical protein
MASGFLLQDPCIRREHIYWDSVWIPRHADSSNTRGPNQYRLQHTLIGRRRHERAILPRESSLRVAHYPIHHGQSSGIRHSHFSRMEVLSRWRNGDSECPVRARARDHSVFMELINGVKQRYITGAPVWCGWAFSDTLNLR